MINYRVLPSGIYTPDHHVDHRCEEYCESGFQTLWEMQDRHFWYLGRHRFILRAVDRYVPRNPLQDAIDLGGGVGGWVRYLSARRREGFGRIALADSSLTALSMAGEILPGGVDRYQVDLMNLGWNEVWDVGFMLDVIEHLSDDVGALQSASRSLKPGGFMFVTAPAFMTFWSQNDEFAQHLRRYTRRDFKLIGERAGLRLIDVRYFMFFLSPIYLISRLWNDMSGLSHDEKRRAMLKQHRVPPYLLNQFLTLIFSAETPLGHFVRFPWGTSILGVFYKD
jgi:SAM-dependent methyltransferase